MEFLKSWVKDIATVFVLISIIEIVLPNGNMKRYIDMVTGFLVIIVIVTPFVKLIYKDFQIDKEVFRNTVSQVKFEYKDNIELASLQEEQIKEVYVNKIKDEIKELIHDSTEHKVASINISIYEDGINYGEIKDIEIVLEENIDNYEITKDSIVVVQIEEVKIGERIEEMMELQEIDESNEIINTIYNNYNISKDNIKVFLKASEEGEKGG